MKKLSAKTQARKEGRKERIRKLLHNMRATQPKTMVKEQPWLAEVLEHDRLRSSQPGHAVSRAEPSDAAFR